MKPTVALVLGSGGARGIAHIGVIRELINEGYEISSISGSSIGAVIGGLYAMGKLPEYTDWVATLNRRDVWDLMDFTMTTSGLMKGERVFDKMKTFIPDKNIEDMNIPFAAVATDILNETEFVLTEGSFYEAVRASIAIPAVFKPVKVNDKILVDGGVLSPIPIEHVTRNHGDILVVVNLYGNKKDVIAEKNQNGLLNAISKLIATGDKQSVGYLSLLTSISSTMIHKIAKLNIEKYKPDIVINIPCDSASTFDFFKAKELIDMGAIAANEAITCYLKDCI